MINDTITPGFNFYQSANADYDNIKQDFLVRLNEFHVIMDDIKSNPMKGSVQHYLLIGRRGSGKSTLLKRIQIEIETDKKLSNKFIVISLAEEQANIYKLFDLLEEIEEELSQQNVQIEKSTWIDDETLYLRKLFSNIHSAIKKSNKKVILLLDNIDRVFENTQEDASVFREYLLNYDDIKIIGGSTRLTEHFWKYNKPFYEFFRVLELNPLTNEEIKKLLLSWSKKFNIKELRKFVRDKSGQLETIRILTDGLPRTLQFFVNILITKSQESGYEYLRLIMDRVTPLYQERLNSLPPSQRKIVLQMAFLWESVGAKEISVASKMDVKIISAQMKQLVEKGVVNKIDTNNKNNLYRLNERFFNLWLIFTQGSPKEKRRAKCLTIFLENFYNEFELIRIANEHLKAVSSKKITPNKAALLTKAIAQSKYISFNTRDSLIEKTLALSEINDDLRKQLPPTTNEISEIVYNNVASKNWVSAIEAAKSIEQNDGARDYFLGYIYVEKGDEDKALEHLTVAVKYNISFAFYELGLLYARKKSYELAEKYIKLSINSGIDQSIRDLADLYFVTDRFDLAIENYKKAIDLNIENSNFKLAWLYDEIKQFSDAEIYYLKAIEEGDTAAMFNLGLIYYNRNNLALAEKYYIMAVDRNHAKAMVNLASLYEEKKEIDKAMKIYARAVKQNDVLAMNNIAGLYLDRSNFKLAEKYFRKAVEFGYESSCVGLGITLKEINKFEESEVYLKRGISHDEVSLYFLALLYYENNINKESALDYLNKYISATNDKLALSFLVTIKAWVGKFDLLEDDFVNLILQKNTHLESAIYHLIVHKQYNLLNKVFQRPDFQDILKDEHPIFSYLLNLLDLVQVNSYLKIPPELLESVNDILKMISSDQEYYYKNVDKKVKVAQDKFNLEKQ